MDARNLTSVGEWETSLPRTCRQNVRWGVRAVAERGWVVREVPIRPAAARMDEHCDAEGETDGRPNAVNLLDSSFVSLIQFYSFAI